MSPYVVYILLFLAFVVSVPGVVIYKSKLARPDNMQLAVSGIVFVVLAYLAMYVGGVSALKMGGGPTY